MIESTKEYTFLELQAESTGRWGQPSFHLLSEGQVRAQILNLRAGTQRNPVTVSLVSLFTGITGELKIIACDREFSLRPLSQLVLLPNVTFSMQAAEDAACEWLQVPLAK
jgi:hypothetical protein